MKFIEAEVTPSCLDAKVLEIFNSTKSAIATAAGCGDVLLRVQQRNAFQVFGIFTDAESKDVEEIELASFKLHLMPGCSAILVSSKERVTIPWRGKGVGKLLQQLRYDTAKALGCRKLQCTTIASNERQNHLLERLNWRKVDQFDNPKTGNTVLVWTRSIE